MKSKLTLQQKHILFEPGTELPFTGKYRNHHEKGIYICANCGKELFSSDTKFESGTGWPSFYQPVKKGNVKEHTDSTLGMKSIEV